MNTPFALKNILVPAFGLFIFFVMPTKTAAQCSITCNGLIHVSLSPNCDAEITPEVMITNLNSTNCLGPFNIEIYNLQGTVIPTNPIVTGLYIGQTLEVKAIDSISGQYCWGNIFIEDKYPPIFVCEDDTVACNEPIPPIVVNDSCDPNPTLTFTESINDFDCTNPDFLSEIIRNWTATDSSGNSNSCQQTIRVARPDIMDVDFPPHFDGINGPMLDCSNPTTHPDSTGYPTLNGGPLPDACMLNFFYNDQIIDICEGSFKILRTWTVLDWCNSSSIRSHIQIIKVIDQTAPEITCPLPFTTSTDSDDCTATLMLPEATATDDCSSPDSISFTTSWAFGTGSGPFTGIPLCTHVITYSATDDCNNTATCTTEVTVEDQIIPVAVCNPITVGLINDTTKVFATSVDAGSSDNCAIDSFAVRRMEDSLFMECVILNCDDVGDTVIVVFQVCDTAGLCNQCMIPVTVTDKTPPSIVCPNDMNLSCQQYPPDLTTAGMPVITDNCGIDSVYVTDVEDINECNVGTITRFWIAVGQGGLRDTCIQLLTFNNPFSSIPVFPPNINAQCFSQTDTADTEFPIIMGICPNQFAIGFVDLVIPVIPNCKFIIERTWTVLDECSNMIFTHLQTITVEDTIDPVFIPDSGDLDVQFVCLDDVVLPDPPTAIDNCVMPEVQLVSTDTTNGSCNGNYMITRIHVAVDSCGNESLPFTTTITVEDTIPPMIMNCPSMYASTTDPMPPPDTMECFGLFTNLEFSGTDNCDSINFYYTRSDMPGMQFSGNNASGEYPIGMTTITLFVDDGCQKDSCVVVREVFDIGAPDLMCSEVFIGLESPDDVDTVFASQLVTGDKDCSPPVVSQFKSGNPDFRLISCADIGPDFLTKLPDTILAVDQIGNFISCNTHINVFNLGCNAVPLGTAALVGQITLENGTPFDDAQIHLSGGEEAITTIIESGVYAFPALALHEGYTITPKSNVQPLNGVNTLDLILISQHILAMESLDSPYKMIAADVNKSGNVSITDLYELSRLILYMDTVFLNNDSWRFINSEFIFDNPAEPFVTTFPESIVIDTFVNNMLNIDFTAIKTGDVNHSNTISNFTETGDTRNASPLILTLENIMLQAGEEYLIELKSEAYDNMLGYQFAVQLDTRYVIPVDVNIDRVSDKLHLSSDHFNLIGNGLFGTSWFNSSPVSIKKDETLFALNIVAKENIALNHVIAITPNKLQPEVYDETKNKAAVELQLNQLALPEEAFVFTLFQNQPNPFKNQSVIPFTLPIESNILLTITDVSGKVIKSVEGKYDKGYHEIIVDRIDLKDAGVYFYQLTAGQYKATRKMILNY